MEQKEGNNKVQERLADIQRKRMKYTTISMLKPVLRDLFQKQTRLKNEKSRSPNRPRRRICTVQKQAKKDDGKRKNLRDFVVQLRYLVAWTVRYGRKERIQFLLAVLDFGLSEQRACVCACGEEEEKEEGGEWTVESCTVRGGGAREMYLCSSSAAAAMTE